MSSRMRNRDRIARHHVRRRLCVLQPSCAGARVWDEAGAPESITDGEIQRCDRHVGRLVECEHLILEDEHAMAGAMHARGANRDEESPRETKLEAAAEERSTGLAEDGLEAVRRAEDLETCIAETANRLRLSSRRARQQR